MIEEKTGWVVWREGKFVVQAAKPSEADANRETLARFYVACAKKGTNVRSLWREERGKAKTLPGIVADDGFLRMFALGEPLSAELMHRIWRQLKHQEETLSPITVEWNKESSHYHDVDATPPGVLTKFSIMLRLRVDQEQLKLVREDLKRAAHIPDQERRRWITLALLSHGAVYREIEGKVLEVPSFTEAGKCAPYKCHKHFIAEGVKTVSLEPLEEGAIPFYICQGTELWPSQPTMLGSIAENFAKHGAATAAYAHSWRRIHKHLRDLTTHNKPIVAGHSMGGSLAMQMGLYSHDLIDSVYAFNPPVPGKRDYEFYHQMDPKLQERIHVTVNLDDFAFWRIGERVIGQVTLFLGKKRWRYTPVGLWDCIFVIPAFVKFILNVRRAFPAHQCIMPLTECFVSVKLSDEEIKRENLERRTRFDYLRFFPKLYDPTKTVLRFLRKLFGWGQEAQVLRNEIEIIALHERDLIDTVTDDNRAELERELTALRRQKERLRQQLLRRK